MRCGIRRYGISRCYNFRSMTFVGVTLPERERFIKQTTGCHIPGYTGHCPTLKFRFGKSYGTDTKEIIEELKDAHQVNFIKPHREEEPWSNTFKSTVRERGEELDPTIYVNLPRRSFILGYTGFIPGLNFEYGMPFNTAANKSVMKFNRRLADEERKRQLAGMQFANSAPKMCCLRGKDEVLKAVEKNARIFYKSHVPAISPELPPLAGYTGHIPGIKGNEASLSQRYCSAAKAGLAKVREERNRRHHLDAAEEAVAGAISCFHAK